jgi:hypothetical protein
MNNRSLWCPNNGCGMINGAASISSAAACKHCGNPSSQDPFAYDGGMTTYHKSCPKCFRCVCCDRVIKRMYTGEVDAVAKGN